MSSAVAKKIIEAFQELQKALKEHDCVTRSPVLNFWVNPTRPFLLSNTPNVVKTIDNSEILPQASSSTTQATLQRINQAVNNLLTNSNIEQFKGELANMLQTYGLIPSISEEFEVMSCQEFAANWISFREVFRLLETFSKHKFLQPLLVNIPHTDFCLMRSFQIFICQVNSFLVRLQQEDVSMSAAMYSRIPEMAVEVFETYEGISAIMSKSLLEFKSMTEDDIEGRMTVGRKERWALKTKYKEKMQRFQWIECYLFERNTFSADPESAVEVSPEECIQFAAEFEGLKNWPRIHLRSSLFAAVDECNPRLLQALITGMEGSSKANGFFMYDLFLPSGYPKVLPRVRRRAPHLEVFIEEVRPEWFLYGLKHPETPTLLEILWNISYWSFPPIPRPGEQLSEQAKMYKTTCHESTCIYFMFYPLVLNHTSVFGEVMLAHALLKKEVITKQLRQWMAEESMTSENMWHFCYALRKLLNRLSLVYTLDE